MVCIVLWRHNYVHTSTHQIWWHHIKLHTKTSGHLWSQWWGYLYTSAYNKDYDKIENCTIAFKNLLSALLRWCIKHWGWFIVILLTIKHTSIKTLYYSFLARGVGWCHVMGKIIEAVSSKQVNQFWWVKIKQSRPTCTSKGLVI